MCHKAVLRQFHSVSERLSNVYWFSPSLSGGVDATSQTTSQELLIPNDVSIPVDMSNHFSLVSVSFTVLVCFAFNVVEL